MASMTTRDDALQFGAVDWQRLIREGAVADQHAAAIKGAEASSLEAVLGDAAAARAYAAALAAAAGGVDDGAARRYCVTKAEDVLVADGAAAAKAQLFAPGGLANFVAAAGKAARAGDAYSTRVAAAQCDVRNRSSIASASALFGSVSFTSFAMRTIFTIFNTRNTLMIDVELSSPAPEAAR